MGKWLHANRWLLYIGIIAIIISTVVLTGPDLFKGRFPGGASKNASAHVSPEPVMQKVRIVLDSTPNASHAFIYAADQMGFLREQGLSLEVVIPNVTDDGLKMVGNDRADLALAHQPDVLFARQQQLPVISIAATIRYPLTYLTLPKASPVHTPRNLEGKTVGYAKQLDEAIVRTMLEDDDADADTVHFASVGWSYIEALTERRVDALIGPTIVHDRLMLEHKEIPVRVVEPMLYGVPSYYETVLAANETKLSEDPEFYQKIWTALVQGQEYVISNPDDAVRMVLLRQPAYAPLDREVERAGLELLLPFMNAGDEPFGHQDGDVWSEVASWLTDLELIDSSLESDSAYINVEVLQDEAEEEAVEDEENGEDGSEANEAES